MRFVQSLLLVVVAVSCCSASAVRPQNGQDEKDSRKGRQEEEYSNEPQYESDHFNHWVDNFLRPFSTDFSLWNQNSDAVLDEAAQSMLSKALDPSIDDRLLSVYRTQCGSKPHSTNQYQRQLAGKNACLLDTRRNLTQLAGDVEEHRTIRDQVSSKLICNVLPEVTSCFAPVIAAIISCTGDGESAFSLFERYQQQLLTQYCQPNDGHLAGVLHETPQGCIEGGLGYFLKFSGPAFLKNIQADAPKHYPCSYAQYLSSAAAVVFKMHCNAEDFTDSIGTFGRNFGSVVGCLGPHGPL